MSLNGWHGHAGWQAPPMPRRHQPEPTARLAPEQTGDLVADLHMHLVAIDDFRQGLLRLLAEAERTNPAAVENRGLPVTSGDGQMIAPFHGLASGAEEWQPSAVDPSQ
eukprot:5222875-Amphidinium_carterae.1